MYSTLTEGGLYSTDGTYVTLVKSFGPGGSVHFLHYSVILITNYFLLLLQLVKGYNSGQPDGTTAGTSCFYKFKHRYSEGAEAIILPDVFSMQAEIITHKLLMAKYFLLQMMELHGEELWITDGTCSRNCIWLKILMPGADSSLFTGI